MNDKIYKIKVKDTVYDIIDNDFRDFLNDETNVGKYLRVGADGVLEAAEIIIPEEEVTVEPAVLGEGEPYESIEAALEAMTTGTIKMMQDLESANSIIIKEGQNIILDMNGHRLSAASGFKTNQGFVQVSFGGELTVTGNGVIDAKKGNAFGLYSGSSTTPGKLTIENGTFIGYTYAISGNASNTATSTDVVINGGIFKATQPTDGIAFYHPQNGTLVINGGEFIGATGLEIRAGKATINDGYFEGRSAFSIVPNGGGGTSTGCGITVAQHTTKQALEVTIKNGLFKGQYAFYEGNPQNNDAEALAKIKLDIQGGSFIGDAVEHEAIHSDTQKNFLDKTKIRASEMIDTDLYK